MEACAFGLEKFRSNESSNFPKKYKTKTNLKSALVMCTSIGTHAPERLLHHCLLAKFQVSRGRGMQSSARMLACAYGRSRFGKKRVHFFSQKIELHVFQTSSGHIHSHGDTCLQISIAPLPFARCQMSWRSELYCGARVKNCGYSHDERSN